MNLPSRRLLLVSDPIGGSASVQFDLLSALHANLRNRFRVSVYTPYCEANRRQRLVESGCELITPPGKRFAIDRVLRFAGSGNESMLWAESWLREAMLGRNSTEFVRTVGSKSFDYVVNLSMTVPAASNLWWILGTPLDQTIEGMAGSNVVADFARVFARRLIGRLDRSVVDRIEAQTGRIVANSPYLRELHRERGTAVDGVVYTLTDISDFRPVSDSEQSKYVLLYMGKETQPIDFGALTKAGVRLVAFGSKIPIGMRLNGLMKHVEYLGRVSRERLISLYSNALFTLFPFTLEPMGLVPIESMACGTPVLTYNRQGPASTVVNGTTGWLVDTPEEMVEKAIGLWERGSTGISPQECVRRAREFTVEKSVNDLIYWIECPASTRREAVSAS